jgi:hypothetical protein
LRLLRRGVLHRRPHALSVLWRLSLGPVSTVCEPCSRADPKSLYSCRATPRAAHAVRMGLRCQADPRPDAAALHGLPAAAHGSRAAATGETPSGRTAAGAAHAVRVALRREAYGHPDPDPLHSMLAASPACGFRFVPVRSTRGSGDAGVAKIHVFGTPVSLVPACATLRYFAPSQPVFGTPRWALNPAPSSEPFGTWFSGESSSPITQIRRHLRDAGAPPQGFYGRHVPDRVGSA